MAKKRKKIAKQLEAAFQDIPYPPEDDPILLYPGGWAAIAIPDLLRGRHWRDLTLDLIIEQKLNISILSPKAFCFYLPAFIRAALLFPDEVDILPSIIVLNLAPPKENEPDTWAFFERMHGFTPSQREVLKDYVARYVRIETSYEDETRDRAAEYWLKDKKYEDL